ncbi:DoxX family protein [Subtercola boreus]|uniref:DoxX family protein n=1 Tax=Subtercola boreus TaxID=120213 RepID=A0A3E0W8X3_9MICO|nr:hypothetical protein [Subtercola boreus]RFA19042.1 hypothetical protein B7R24_12980 [Subtercola boreus]RFA19180.1 hypothetical protein B7R23_12960 [Subtercola boreus]RFA25642.1 hypothetical protein B7R25_13080 [Subtercola boreus]
MKPSVTALAALVLGSTVIHFVRPATFEAAIPPQLPGSRRGWVYVSGAAELLVGTALLSPTTRRHGALAAAALFVAVFPANVQMFRDARNPAARRIAAVRLPLQLPLIAWALHLARADQR